VLAGELLKFGKVNSWLSYMSQCNWTAGYASKTMCWTSNQTLLPWHCSSTAAVGKTQIFTVSYISSSIVSYIMIICWILLSNHSSSDDDSVACLFSGPWKILDKDLQGRTM